MDLAASRTQVCLEIAYLVLVFGTQTLWSFCKYVIPRAPHFTFRAVLSRFRRLRDKFYEVTHARTLPELQYAKFMSHDEIRLLTILPRGGTDILYCKLEAVTLDDSLDFSATSYTWSTLHAWPGLLAALFAVWYFVCVFSVTVALTFFWPAQFRIESTDPADHPDVQWFDRNFKFLTRKDGQHVIVCNGQIVRVGENLHEFLLQLRRDQDPRSRYWIDALCINQHDVEERNQQILLMPKIYTTARRVLAWLGPCPRILDDTRIMRSAIGKIWDESSESTWEMFLPHLMRCYLIWRPYFMRVWIVQEILLAKQVCFLLGSHQLSLEELQQMFDITARVMSPVFPRFVSDKIISVNTLLASRSRYNRHDGWSLVDYLVSTVGRSATDPHDLVYAGLGTLQTHIVETTRSKIGAIVTYPDRYKPSLLDRPDYAADIRDTVVHCAIRLLKEEGLGMLSLAYDGNPDQAQAWFEVPSWLPHFSTSSSHSIRLADKSQTYAAGGTNQSRVTVTHSELLRLDSGAVLLDSVEVVFESGLNAVDDLLLRMLDASESEYPSTGERNFVALARTLMADRFQGERLEPGSATSRMVRFLRNRLEKASRTAEFDDRRAQLIQHRMPWDFATVSHLDQQRKDVVQERSRLLSMVEKDPESQDPAQLDERDLKPQREEVHYSSHSENSTAPPESEITNPDKIQTGSVLDSIQLPMTTHRIREMNYLLYPEQDPYDTELEEKLQHHSFFITKDGRFGLGSPYLQKGDVVLVLAGAAVPYVGRRLNSIQPTPRFKVIGEAYVHGIMDGELVGGDLWRPEVITFR